MVVKINFTSKIDTIKKYRDIMPVVYTNSGENELVKEFNTSVNKYFTENKKVLKIQFSSDNWQVLQFQFTKTMIDFNKDSEEYLTLWLLKDYIADTCIDVMIKEQNKQSRETLASDIEATDWKILENNNVINSEMKLTKRETIVYTFLKSFFNNNFNCQVGYNFPVETLKDLLLDWCNGEKYENINCRFSDKEIYNALRYFYLSIYDGINDCDKFGLIRYSRQSQKAIVYIYEFDSNFYIVKDTTPVTDKRKKALETIKKFTDFLNSSVADSVLDIADIKDLQKALETITSDKVTGVVVA